MRLRARLLPATVLLSTALFLVGCSGTTGAGPASTATATTIPATATPAPPPHALAWFKQDSNGVGQVWASINDGPLHQITHMPKPAGDCVRDQHWSPPVFSPNLAHILAGWGSGACGDGPEQGDLYLINSSTGAVTPVKGPSSPANIRLSLRQAGWIDNTHIWWTDEQQLYEYTFGTTKGVALGQLASSSGSSYELAADAVLRGNTLFFVTVTGTAGNPHRAFSLGQFDLTMKSVVPGAISLGTDSICQCSLGDITEPGFDVSADGKHVAYQVVTPLAKSGALGIAGSKFYYANADGSGATQIASYATSNAFVRMQLSPNGQLVSISNALPSPSLVTASVTSPGAKGDPKLVFYHPDGASYAVWDWRGDTIWACMQDVGTDSPAPTIYRFAAGTANGGTFAAGNNPWYTIGQ